jgi:hypothetical protein
MDNIELLLYIIFGVVYFLYKTFGSKKPDAPRQKRPNTAEQETSERPRAKTFEEVLREISGLDRIEEEMRRQRMAEEAKLKAEQESAAYLQDLRAKTENLKTLDEQVTLQQKDTDRIFKDYKDRVDEASKSRFGLAQTILDDLRDRTEVQKAIIYSEILNRKY